VCLAQQVWVVSENLKDDTVVHPADALASALDRAHSLLLVLMDLYDSRREEFVGGNPFIVHGMSTVNDLIDDARNALSDLHDSCDLSLVAAKAASVTTNIVELTAKPPEAGANAAKPALKPIAAAVVTLQEVDDKAGKTAKGYRQL
jgi:hypothetical protein